MSVMFFQLSGNLTVFSLGNSGWHQIKHQMSTSIALCAEFNGARWMPTQRGSHYNDVIMGEMASKTSSLTIVYSTAYTGAYQRKHQSSITGLCAGNSPVTGEFPAQMASNAENGSIWWRHHGNAKRVSMGRQSSCANLAHSGDFVNTVPADVLIPKDVRSSAQCWLKQVFFLTENQFVQSLWAMSHLWNDHWGLAKSHGTSR